MRVASIALGLALLGECAGVRAQQAPATAQRPEDERAIAALVEAFSRAFNAGDAAGVAATYAEDALVVD